MRAPLAKALPFFSIGNRFFEVAFLANRCIAAAISRAGGLGVLGAVRYNDGDELEAALTWLDANTDGRPYGVDVVMPAKVPAEGTQMDLGELIRGPPRLRR